MAEVFRITNGVREYVGYVNRKGEIVDTRRGGLGGATMTAGARGARRNPAQQRGGVNQTMERNRRRNAA